MKIFQTPSYDRFCLFEMERKSKDFRGMDDNVAYKNKQIDNVEISNEGRRALREKLREVKPKVEEPIGYELTIQDTNEVEWEHYISMREYSGLTLKDGKYNLEDVMKSMMDAYETRYNYIVKEHENGERQVSYNLTGENSLTLDDAYSEIFYLPGIAPADNGIGQRVGTNMKIEVSNDQINWTTAAENTDGSVYAWKNVSVAAVGKYIRITSMCDNLAINEFALKKTDGTGFATLAAV